MLGLLINESEQGELSYVIRRELDELLFDMGDDRIDPTIKQAMRERYRVLFQLFRRVANEQDCLRYILK